MPTFKSAKARMKEAVNKAVADGNSFLANEITANVMVGTTMMLIFVVMILCLILNELTVFSADQAIMRWAVLIAGAIEVPITILNTIYVGTKPWLKIPLMVDLILVCGILAATLGHNVTLVMVFPIVVSTRYFDKKYTWIVALITTVVFIGATIVNGFLGIANLNVLKFSEGTTIVVNNGSNLREAIINNPDFNRWNYVKLEFINDFIPRLLVFLCLSVSCMFVASRGKHMIDLHAENVKKTSRIETELDLATKIQTSMLPCIFPAFPDHDDIELRAVYFPAKEVGGDFYDYFNIDKTHVGMVIADVSGKGVGAALFMTISKTVLKNQLQLGISPAQAIKNANRQLCENNDAGLFVTCWAGVYDIESRTLTFVNAGHNPPVIIKKDGKAEYVKARTGFVLAGMDGFDYKQEEIKLDTGDGILFYTDGVTEATDKDNNLYGEERLLNCVEKCRESDTAIQLEAVKNDIDAFVGDAEQFDDITVMALKIR